MFAWLRKFQNGWKEFWEFMFTTDLRVWDNPGLLLGVPNKPTNSVRPLAKIRRREVPDIVLHGFEHPGEVFSALVRAFKDKPYASGSGIVVTIARDQVLDLDGNPQPYFLVRDTPDHPEITEEIMAILETMADVEQEELKSFRPKKT